MPDPTAASRAARADNGQFFNSLLGSAQHQENADSDHGYPEQYGGQTDDEELRSRRHAIPYSNFSLENGIKAKPDPDKAVNVIRILCHAVFAARSTDTVTANSYKTFAACRLDISVPKPGNAVGRGRPQSQEHLRKA